MRIQRKYEQSDLMKALANKIVDLIKQNTRNLSYDKTYIGFVTEKNEDSYKIKIHDRTFSAKSKFNYQIGESVRVTAIQNHMNNLILKPGYNQIMELIRQEIQSENSKTK